MGTKHVPRRGKMTDIVPIGTTFTTSSALASTLANADAKSSIGTNKMQWSKPDGGSFMRSTNLASTVYHITGQTATQAAGRLRFRLYAISSDANYPCGIGVGWREVSSDIQDGYFLQVYFQPNISYLRMYLRYLNVDGTFSNLDTFHSGWSPIEDAYNAGERCFTFELEWSYSAPNFTFSGRCYDQDMTQTYVDEDLTGITNSYWQSTDIAFFSNYSNMSMGKIEFLDSGS